MAWSYIKKGPPTRDRKGRIDAVDLSNRRFGRLIVINIAKRARRTHWLCHCDCGNRNYITQTTNLTSGHTRSCGCLRKELQKARKGTHNLPENRRLRRHSRGMSVAEYSALLKNQKGRCAICRKLETIFDKRAGKTRSLALDHNHRNNKNRGLLCHRCNQGIGSLRDSVEILKRAIKYLRRFENE